MVIPFSSLSYAAVGILPSIFWLTFFLREDRKHPEPKRLISLTFIFGAVGALAALFIQIGLALYTPLRLSDPSPFSLLAFAFVEEITKFLSVYFFIHKNRFFDEPVDGMIYMITGAMGFAAFENILYTINYPYGVAALTVYRLVGAILVHALASGFIGYYWIRRKLFLGIAVATAVHWLFNLIVLYFQNGAVIGPALLGIVSFFIFRDFAIMKRYDRRKQT